MLLTRLESKLVEIRSYHINWESYHQGEMIEQKDFQFISHYDRLNLQEKENLFVNDHEQVSTNEFYRSQRSYIYTKFQILKSLSLETMSCAF